VALNLNHQSPGEFAARFWKKARQAFQSGNKTEFCRLMWWLTERLVAGDITDTQARSSFNTAYSRSLTAGQWTTLRASRITPAHDRWVAMLAEADL
jgi:hypothetical protein